MPPKPKSSTNNGVATPALVKQLHGGALAVGNPGNKGGRGTLGAYRIWLKTLVDSPKHRAEFQRILEDGDHPQFIPATKHAAAYAVGLPTQKVEVADASAEPMNYERARALIMAAQGRLAGMDTAAAVLRGIEQAEIVSTDEDA